MGPTRILVRALFVVLLAVGVFSPLARASVRVHQKPTQDFAAHSTDRFLVVIDPGHGGTDTGAVYHSAYSKQGAKQSVVYEKDLTLALAQKLKAALVSQGIPVIMTRSSDDKLSLDMRAAIAHRARGSVFLSLHMNASHNPKDHGLETYVLNTNSNKAARRLSEIENGRGHQVSTLSLILADLGTTAHYKDSVRLGCTLQKTLVRSPTDVRGRTSASFGGSPQEAAPAAGLDRGVKQALFYLLMQVQMPSVLIEAGFPSNPTERLRLTQTRYQKAWADRAATAVLAYKQGAPPPAPCTPQ